MDEELFRRARIGRVLPGDGLAVGRWRLATRRALGTLVTRWQADSGYDEQQAAEKFGLAVSRYHAMRFAEASWRPHEFERFGELVGREPDAILEEIIRTAAVDGGPPVELGGTVDLHSRLVRQLVALSTDEWDRILREVVARRPGTTEGLRRVLDEVEDG